MAHREFPRPIPIPQPRPIPVPVPRAPPSVPPSPLGAILIGIATAIAAITDSLLRRRRERTDPASQLDLIRIRARQQTRVANQRVVKAGDALNALLDLAHAATEGAPRPMQLRVALELQFQMNAIRDAILQQDNARISRKDIDSLQRMGLLHGRRVRKRPRNAPAE